MFCTKCGAQALNGDMFCPECGAKLKHTAASGSDGSTNQYAGYSAPQPQSWEPSGRVYESYSKPVKTPKNKADRKRNRSVGVIAALLLLVVAAMLIFAGMRGYLGENIGSLFASCGKNGEQVETMLPVSQTDADKETTETASTTETTVTTTTTTTTTKPTTTTTTVDAKKLEAEEIRNLLVSRTWKTQLEGYDATVKFNKDGTATITVKIFLFNKSFDAKYSVNDKCHAVIQAEYEGQVLGISGDISKVSNTKLVVERDKNMGKVTLNAA